MIQYQFLQRPVSAVLLDLDGTLADTAGDLIRALNLLLAEQGREPVDYQAYRATVSRGSRGLITDAFCIDTDHPSYRPLRQRYLDLYETLMRVETILFPGMTEVLQRWDQDRVPWGVVTNKPRRFTEPLMAGFGLLQRAACIITPDDVSNPKPHPEPLRQACQELDTAPHRVLYVGDAWQDMQAGRAAGTQTLLAAYGYLDNAADRENWPADAAINDPAELMRYVKLET